MTDENPIDEPIEPIEPTRPVVDPGFVPTVSGEAAASDEPTVPYQSSSPWAPPATGTAPAPPAPPLMPPTPAGRPSGWRQFVVGVVIGALVGGATAAGVTVATREDPTTTNRTVVVGAATQPVRNSSVIGNAKDVQSVLSKVDGAVVAIRTGAAVDNGLFSGNENDNGTGGEGTGFVISSDGVIVTNSHVVADAGDRIEVEFGDGTKQVAELVGRAPDFDLAVLKVEGKNLPTAKLGSSDALQVGDSVVAVGNALALAGGLSVTQGIVSGKGRTVPEETGARLYDMLQTDAAINPGNSGGPLMNTAGEVVGINTALAGGSQNVGFAISIDSAKSIISQLRDGKRVSVAFLGVETSEVTPAIARSLDLTTKIGAVVQRVTNGGGADKAGIKRNDVIVAIAGVSVSSPEDVGGAIRRFTPGDQTEITIERGGEEQTIPVTLGTRPDSLG